MTKHLVLAHERQLLDVCLSDQQAVEGVLVMITQFLKCKNVLKGDRQHSKATFLPLLVYQCRKRRPQLELLTPLRGKPN